MRKLAVAVICGAALVAGCGDNDASVEGRDTGPANKINFPDHFDTVARKCDGPNMVYLTQNSDGSSSAVAVAPEDRRCTNETP